MNIQELVKNQRIFYNEQHTKKIKDRINTVKKIKKWIITNQNEIFEALKKDLNKSETESYMCEVGFTLDDISYQLKHIHKWSKARKVKSGMANFQSKSFIMKEPYGVTLIMSPWNYPFSLSVQPLIASILAGNTVILKPSDYSSYTSKILKKMIEETCDSSYLSVVLGGVEECNTLLEQKFDYIFFTGSVPVGKIVMEKASHNLTPVTLELGGKSPCIVDDDVDLDVYARRIAFGKFLNAGQTCVAPDYLFIKENVKEAFLKELQNAIEELFGNDPISNEELVKIINKKHYDRLSNLLESQDIIIGGKKNGRKLLIEPTVIDNIDFENKIMQEEIFGPILPIITYTNIDEVINILHEQEKPLALYVFSNDKQIQKRILNEVSFGGGCINDTISHLVNNNLPFGGVGNSGIGQYHGKDSFNTFTHEKSIVKKYTWLDIPLRYYPFNKKKNRMIRKFLK